ncbi:MAG: alpha/beta hydrolase [Verrucomicrobiota bacterium]
MRTLRRLLYLGLGTYGLLLAGCAAFQRQLLYFPTQKGNSPPIQTWKHGVTRPANEPQTIWLLLHGNAGQAQHRLRYPCFPPDGALYILEYPGYGPRPGQPSRESFNRAAEEAYLELRKDHPGLPLIVVGESIGSGPACHLATLPTPPDKLILATPFDELARVAQNQIPLLPIRWILRDNWNNLEALRAYHGPLEIWIAENDRVIPPQHAETLAQSRPQAILNYLPGGHNDWSPQARFTYQGSE